MPTSRAVKKRIRSTKNIAQITKAMEAVSAVKMRRSQAIALRSRPYAKAASEIIRNLVGSIDPEHLKLSPLLQEHESGRTGLMVVTSDKGLCGAFNSGVLRAALDFIEREPAGTVDVIAVGKKGADFLMRRGVNLVEKITGTGDYGAIDETKFLSDFISALYASGKYRGIQAVSATFVSVMKQETVVEKILPFAPETFRGDKPFVSDYLFEPSPEEVLTKLLPLLLEIQIYHIILEANASEHSARMMAMKNASDNASELIENLTLLYNKARQAQITKELTEITAGAAALER